MYIKSGSGQMKAVEASLSAVVIRANGKVEDKGILGHWYDPEYWYKKVRRGLKKEKLNPMADVVTNAGFAIVTNTLVNLTLTPKYMAWGTGAGTAAVGNTTLFTEDYTTTNDGTHNIRVTGTLTQQTTTQTNDTFRIVGTLTAYGSQTITNFGTFDTNGQAANTVTAPSGGNLYIKSDFTGIVLAAADAIQFTANVKYT